MDNQFSINKARSMDASSPLYGLRKRFNFPMFKGEEAIYFQVNFGPTVEKSSCLFRSRV